MSDEPQGEPPPLASLNYLQVRITLMTGFVGDFDAAAPTIWQEIPEVIKVGAMRKQEDPWKVFLLTLDIDTEKIRAQEIVSNIRRDERVGDVELLSETATIRATEALLQREPEAQRRPKLFGELALLFFVYDPVSINFYVNTDEYVPEVRTVLPRLDTMATANEIPRIIHEEFSRWFGGGTAGPIERYERLGEKVSRLWASQ